MHHAIDDRSDQSLFRRQRKTESTEFLVHRILGGSGVASFAGGVIATNLGWKWIFIFSIIFAVLGMFLLKDTPESKQESSGSFQFDFAGLSIFIVTMLALNIFITYGASFGWLSLQTLGILAVILAGLMILSKLKQGKRSSSSISPCSRISRMPEQRHRISF